MSRRRLLGAAGVAALGTAALTFGPIRAPVSANGPAPGTPRYGGRLQSAGLAGPLDPHVSITGWTARIYNVLVARSPFDHTFVLHDLAETIEQPDETTWIFSIRPGVRIAPNNIGIPQRNLDAQDVFQNFERIRGLPRLVGSSLASAWIGSHEAVDAQTYVIRTMSPYAYLLDHVGTPLMAIVPRELLSRFVADPFTASANGVGGGPFVGRLVGGGLFDADLVLDKNPNYYRRDTANSALPYVDGWDVKLAADSFARFALQHSHSYSTLSAATADSLLGQYDVYDIVEPLPSFVSLVLNVKRPPWNDPRIRKAALYALNRQEYSDLIYGGDAPANGIVHWPLAKFALPDSELDQLQPYDPQMARQLIMEATGQQSVTVRVSYPVTEIEQHHRHLPIFRQQMGAAGFNLEEEPQDFAFWLSNYQTKDYDSTLALNATYDTPETPLDFHHSAGPGGNNQFSNGLQDPAIDAAIDAARSILNQQELVAAVQDVQRQIYEAGPACIPLVSPWTHTLYWNFVQNVPKGLGSAGLFLSNIWLEEGATGRVGDANCSGGVDAIDALLTLQRDAGLVGTLPCEAAADVNRDGATNAIDALFMLQTNVGLLPGLL